MRLGLDLGKGRLLCATICNSGGARRTEETEM